MKMVRGVCLIGCLLASAMVAEAAPKPSKLSAFAGKYKGSINFSGGAFGPATGIFKASKKKENGALKLNSTIAGSGISATLQEVFSIRGRKFTYTFTANASGLLQAGAGSGSVKVFKNSIKFVGTANVNGTDYLLNCTVEETSKGIDVTNTLVGSGGAVITYKLKQKGK